MGRKITKKEPLKVLYILSQKPGNTGSGIYLKYITKEALRYNIDMRVIIGISEINEISELYHIPQTQIFPLIFTKDIPFIITGMSDVMPYPSTKFSDFTDEMFYSYCKGFKATLKYATENWTPDILHSNHLWVVSALARSTFKDIPLVVSCHGTELRQRITAAKIEKKIVKDLKKVDIILALTEEQKSTILKWLKIPEQKVVVTGSGYANDIFYCNQNINLQNKDFFTVIYAGKISSAKGVPYLIDAFKGLNEKVRNKIKLYIVGDYSSAEGERIRNSIVSEHFPNIYFFGKLSQQELADKLRESQLFILPSFFEGLPLVVMESIACGCAVVVSELPDISLWINRELVDNEVVKFIQLPEMESIDTPIDSQIDYFTNNIKEAILCYANKFFNKEYPDVKRFRSFITQHSFENLFKKIVGIYSRI